jgi:hypothetical protein
VVERGEQARGRTSITPRVSSLRSRSKWLKVVESGLKWFKVVQSGSKWCITAAARLKCARSRLYYGAAGGLQSGEKSLKVVESGLKWFKVVEWLRVVTSDATVRIFAALLSRRCGRFEKWLEVV